MGDSTQLQKKPITHICYLLDASGSMDSLQDTIISAFNELVGTTKRNAYDQDCRVSLFTFSHEVREIFFEAPVDALQEINQLNYRPAGNTALYDALHISTEKLMALPDFTDPTSSFLLSIFSDGQSNSDKLTTAAGINRRIKMLQDKKTWTFTICGANFSLTDFCETTGIPVGNSMAFEATKSATTSATNRHGGSVGNFMRRRSRGPGGQSITNSDNFYQP